MGQHDILLTFPFSVPSSPDHYPVSDERAVLESRGGPQPPSGPRAPRPPPLSLRAVPPGERHGRDSQRVSQRGREGQRLREVCGHEQTVHRELRSLSE